MTPTLRSPVCLCVVALAGMMPGDAVSQSTGVSGDGPSNPKAGPAAAVAVWTQFEMNRKDAEGNYLWTTPENWTKGLPSPDLCVEIGDDHSGKALHCVIPAGHDAVCRHFELAEHGRTQGTTLRLEESATFTILESGVLSKDRESTFYVDGSLRCLEPKGGLRVGGPWGRPDVGEPAACHLMIGPTGVVDAWFVGINTTHRAESVPSQPWGPKFFARSTGSEILVDGGRLVAHEGLRISTTDAGRPGALRLKGNATFTSRRDSEFGIDVWGGIWEIDGPQAGIRVGDVEFWGNKFKDAVNTKTAGRVGSALAVLRLTGSGVSTIHAREVNFVDAVVLDVGSLKVPAGTYKVIDGTSIKETNLVFADGIDTRRWSFRLEPAQGDLTVTFSP